MATLQKRKERWAIAGFACLAAMATAPLAINSLQTNGLSLASLDPAKKLRDLLDARSPGERSKGELAQIKIKKKLATAGRRIQPGTPAETPLEKLAQAVVPKEPDAPTLVPPASATVPLIPPAAAASFVPASFGPLGGGPVVIAGSVLGGGGSGGGGGSPPPTVTPPTVTPPVVSPVPEPSSWLMMLMGFGIIGAAARQRRSASRLALS